MLERLPALADRPVILLFGYGRDETMARALEAGAADYIDCIEVSYSKAESGDRFGWQFRLAVTGAPP